MDGFARLDDAELHRTDVVLDDLVLADHVVVVLEEMSEERAGEIRAVLSDDDRLHAPLDPADPRQPAAARARLCLVDRHCQIADTIADEGHAEVVEVGDDDLAELPGTGRYAVLQDLHDVALRDHVVTGVCLALVGDAGELPAPVLVEHAAPERLRHDLPALLR